MTSISIKLNVYLCGLLISSSAATMMAESYEDILKTQLYKKYEVCRRLLIPKDVYFTVLEDLKTAAADCGTKSRHGYYLLSILAMCWFIDTF